MARAHNMLTERKMNSFFIDISRQLEPELEIETARLFLHAQRAGIVGRIGHFILQLVVVAHLKAKADKVP